MFPNIGYVSGKALLSTALFFRVVYRLLVTTVLLVTLSTPEYMYGQVKNGKFNFRKAGWNFKNITKKPKNSVPPLWKNNLGREGTAGLSLGFHHFADGKPAPTASHVWQEFLCSGTGMYCIVNFDAWYPAAAVGDEAYARLVCENGVVASLKIPPDPDPKEFGGWRPYWLAIENCCRKDVTIEFGVASSNKFGAMTNLRIDNVVNSCVDVLPGPVLPPSTVKLFKFVACTDQYNVPDQFVEAFPCQESIVSTDANAEVSTTVTISLANCTTYQLPGTTASTTLCCTVEVSTVCTVVATGCVQAATMLYCTDCTVTTVTKCVDLKVTTTVTFTVRNCIEKMLPGTTATTTICCDVEVSTLCTVVASTCVQLLVCTTETMMALPATPQNDYRNVYNVDDDMFEFPSARGYPNPAQMRAFIEYTVPEEAYVRIELFNDVGKKVRSLLERNLQSRGTHALEFDTSELPAGIYFFRVHIGDTVLNDKLMIAK